MDPATMPTFAFWSRTDRDRVAIVDHDHQTLSVGQVQDAANRVARNLTALGCTPGSTVASCMRNRPEALILAMAAYQVGLYLVPLSWHLTRREAAHILEDSGAKVVVCGVDQAPACRGTQARVCLLDASGGEGRAGPGELSFADDLDTGSADPPAHRAAGGPMTYTSGTTGKPKGVRRPLPQAPPEPVASGFAMFMFLYGMKPDEGVHIVGSPLYHTAVLYFATSALHLGHTVVIMDKWTPEGMLQRIQRYRVTTSHMVPTQFSRLLAVPDRDRFDVSSLRQMVHGAAPCPIPVKQAMLDWWGDCVWEYYAASEGGGTVISPAEWRQRPGSVGRPWQTAEIAIFDDDGHRLGPDQVGTVYIKMAQSFEYHRDKDKTQKAWRTDGYFTVGDAGYLDADGYLFLCDRKADLIISGGVNIYPAEIESVLSEHPRVLDVGKLKKRLLRDPWWEGRQRRI